MSKRVRVNVRAAINASGIRRERRDGRDYIIVPSATMPDDIVMNRVRYPATEIEKAFRSLENTPAPLGHPTVEGMFVSAKDPEGLARGWVGAWNRNVRRENGRVFVDKVIDVATASQLQGGKAVLNAIEKGEPVHTSTGLYAMLANIEGDDDADYEASDIAFDHDAILIGEDGAATPAQGVGMMVNKAADTNGEEIEVINSALDADAERDLVWAAESAIRAAEKLERAPLIERVMDAIKAAVKGPSDPTASTTMENEMTDEELKALSNKVDALSEGFEKISETIGETIANALKPISDQMEADAAARKAKDDADKAVLVNKVVEAGLLDKETAEAADMAVLNALADKAKPGKALKLNGALSNNQNDDEWAGYDLNSFASEGKEAN